jgi:hypothetical protein
MYYKRKAITKQVYDYCIKQGYADGNLMAKWKKVIVFLNNHGSKDMRNYVV